MTLTSAISKHLEAFTDGIEGLEALDRVSELIRPLPMLTRRSRQVKDLLSGTFLGHPLHPLLTDLPIGCFTSAWILDLQGDKRWYSVSRDLIGLGIIFSIPTAVSGASDWLDTADAEQRVGVVHAAGNLAGVALMGISWLRRRTCDGSDGDPVRGRLSLLGGIAVMSVAGWLGGHLSYSMGVGVDTNAFVTGPAEWHDGVRVSDETSPGLGCFEVDGVRIVTIEDSEDTYAAADRCSHRGGPLSQGTRSGYCVRCPWHDSSFDLRDGSVTEGPATVAQPIYETRRDQSKLFFRRSEKRALRRNPI